MAKKSSDTSVQLGLIVTPMLDMSFQLLAFFIMVYHPAALEGHIEGRLLPPKHLIGGPGTPRVDEFPVADPFPELQATVTVKVSALPQNRGERQRAAGMPGLLQLSRPEAPAFTTIADTDAAWPAALARLTKELARILAEPGNTANHVRLEAAATLRHEHVMQVYDACKRAGLHNVSFVAPR